jgi:L-seryl-tRNA(Ser) seleniumtransferase
VRDLLRRTTGAEDGIVVNNNAAALFMVLQVFAQGREVIVSRGQAVEIGGGFRIPDVLRQSGATLVEVGTTNRTYGRDYSAALTENAAAILRVHTSNFRVVGFTTSPGLGELRAVATAGGALLIDDLGSGCLLATEQFGMMHEPTVQESVAAGADLVLFSGDKLLGGPQAGIIVGRGDLVETLRRHPLARALRVDKLTIAALNATLAAYARGTAGGDIPVWRMLSASRNSLAARAATYAAADESGTVGEAQSVVGGGSIPGEGVATPVAEFAVGHPTAVTRGLREADPAVIARIEGDRVILDPRTVDNDDDEHVVSVLKAVICYANSVDPEYRRDV